MLGQVTAACPVFVAAAVPDGPYHKGVVVTRDEIGGG